MGDEDTKRPALTTVLLGDTDRTSMAAAQSLLVGLADMEACQPRILISRRTGANSLAVLPNVNSSAQSLSNSLEVHMASQACRVVTAMHQAAMELTPTVS